MLMLRLLVLTVLIWISMNSAHAIVPGGIVSHQASGQGTAETMSVDIVIEQAPPDDSSYFWAQQFYTSTTTDHGGYFGLQTSGIINNQNVGKIVIFSIWNAVDAVAVGSSISQTFGGEGIGYSIRLPFEWVEGETYRFALTKTDSFWWQLSLNELALGSIKITEDVPLQTTFVGFTEYFRDIETCDDLPEAKAVFRNLTYGSTSAQVVSSTTYGNCADSAESFFLGSDAAHFVSPVAAVETTDSGGGVFHPLSIVFIVGLLYRCRSRWKIVLFPYGRRKFKPSRSGQAFLKR